MVHEVLSYVVVQEESANLEYRGLTPNWFLYLGLLRSAFVVRVFDLNVKSIIIICSDSGPSRVVDIDSVIVRGPELSWAFCCEYRFDSFRYCAWYLRFVRLLLCKWGVLIWKIGI